MSVTHRIDLLPYIKQHAGRFEIKSLPTVDMPDGPTWNDRVKRAEHIRAIVTREFRHHQSEYEETFLDVRDKFLSDVRRQAIAAGFSNVKIEGMILTLTGPSHLSSSLPILQYR